MYLVLGATLVRGCLSLFFQKTKSLNYFKYCGMSGRLSGAQVIHMLHQIWNHICGRKKGKLSESKNEQEYRKTELIYAFDLYNSKVSIFTLAGTWNYKINSWHTLYFRLPFVQFPFFSSSLPFFPSLFILFILPSFNNIGLENNVLTLITLGLFMFSFFALWIPKCTDFLITKWIFFFDVETQAIGHVVCVYILTVFKAVQSKWVVSFI